MPTSRLALLFLLVCVFDKSANGARHDHNERGARGTGAQIDSGSASKVQLENAGADLLMHCNVTGEPSYTVVAAVEPCTVPVGAFCIRNSLLQDLARLAVLLAKQQAKSLAAGAHLLISLAPKQQHLYACETVPLVSICLKVSLQQHQGMSWPNQQYLCQTVHHAKEHAKSCRQDISCVLAAPDAPVRAQVSSLCKHMRLPIMLLRLLTVNLVQFKQKLTHAALLHKAGEAFATHRPCSTAQSGLSLAGFECMMLALLAVSVPVMLWRRSHMSQ